MSKRVMRGDVRTSGRDYVVVRTKRERGGVVVVLGVLNRQGVVHEVETRPMSVVSGWPKKGRVRVSFRPAGGYWIAPWIGLTPSMARGET